MTGKSAGFMHSKRLGWVLAAAVAFVGALLAGHFLWNPQASPTLPPVQITIATNVGYAASCPVIAAKAKGYFADQGIAITIQPQTSGKASMEALLQDKAALATVADIPVMFAGLNRQPVSVIATVFRTEKDHGIVGRKDRGINTLGDLKGKRIGATLNTSGHFALNALLNRQKLAPSDVTIQNYTPAELAPALLNGEVDAIATWEPILDTSLKELGNNGTAFYGQDVYTSLYNIAGKRDYITGNPELIKKVLHALSRGTRLCSEAPEEARTLLAAETKSDPAKMKAAWSSYRFNLTLDQGLIMALEDEARWAMKNNLTSATEMPNYLDYIYRDGLEAIAPTAVTIIH
ncbi:NrtA/SsuA/CpmA family ABC transporter substrate-binding protein [Chitinimonas sp.]|uniref:ABC transporter substrate-binding protein n=1 Tax=Chitinimonas sp. TaxID=1934313 RepID=UPI002F93E034